MTLPASGTITFNNVNVELGVSGTTTRSLNDAAVRSLAGVPSGAISMSNLHGKSYLAFTPDGGTSSGSRVPIDINTSYPSTATATLTCTATATWTYTTTGGTLGTVNVTNNGSATSITFSLASH